MIRAITLTALCLCASATCAAQLPPVQRSLALVNAVAASESAAQAKLLPRQFFLAQPEIALVRLSPDERHVAVLTRNGRDFARDKWDFTLRLLDLSSGKQIERLRSRSVHDLHWSGDSRQLFLQTDAGLAVVNITSGRPHLLIRLDAEKEETFLGVAPTGAATFVSLPGKGDSHEVYRLEANGERELLLRTAQPVHDLLADETGIRYLRQVRDNDQVLIQVSGDAQKEIFRCDFLDACALLASRGDKLLLRSNGNGQYRRLLQLDTKSGNVSELHRDPRGIASLDAVQIGRDDGPPLIASYRSDYRHNYGLGPAAERVRTVEQALAGSDLAIEAHSAAGNWLVRAERSDRRQPHYFLVRAGSDKPEPILEQFLDNKLFAGERQLSAKIPFTYTASDGLKLHAYITLPRGRKLGRTPIIACPHGGPWNRVDSGPNGFTQFLANRGYIVFEPNFRASTGYSRDFALAGRREFGNGRVQQDILDGLDFLLAQGIGDAHKQAIVGHSFGGFSALTGLVFTPDRFVAGVASSPPVDLVSTLRNYSEHFDLRANGVPWSQSLDKLVGDLNDPHFVKTMRAQMPAAYPERIKRPLLVIAGGSDLRVDQRQVKGFVSQVQANGGDIRFLLDVDEGHNFQNPLAREAYLYMTESFLARYLGGRRQSKEAQELQRYLQRTLLIGSDGITRTEPLAKTTL